MKNAFTPIFLMFLALVGVFSFPKPVRAELSIIPTRVVFEDRDRFQEVILLNTGDKTRTYDISWEFYKMIEGSSKSIQERVDGPITDFDLSKYVVFTPRRVTLPPKGRQKIRLALRRPADVPPGDYRAYLRFNPNLEVKKEDQDQDVRGQSVAVNFRYTFSIPVIFQAGDLDVTAKIEKVTLGRNQKNGKLSATVLLSRSGRSSSLGYLIVYDGQGQVIGEISNAHVYPEVSTREFTVPLTVEDIDGDSIEVEYRHYDKDKNIIFDKRQFPIE